MLKSDKGFSLVEVAIVIGLVAITTLAAIRISTYLLQSNNGLTFRLQRMELQRNLRHVFFNGNHCACTFNGISTPFPTTIDVTNRAFIIRQDPLRCDSRELANMLPTQPEPLGIHATEVRLTDIHFLGDPATARRAMAKLEYTINSPKEILGPKTYTDTLLFAMNLQDAGGGRLSIASCGKAPSEVTNYSGARPVRLANNTAAPVSQNIGNTVTGLFLAQLDITSGNNPNIEFYAPDPVNPAQPTILDRYDFSTGVDGRIKSKSLLILLPVFNGQFIYRQRNGDSNSELTPLASVIPPYSTITPLVQFANIKKSDIPVPFGPNDIPVTLSRPNNTSPVEVQYEVRPESANMRSDATLGANFNLPAVRTLTFPPGSVVQNIPMEILPPTGSGNIKTVILRINVLSGGVINYPNEHIVLIQD